ncbi:Bacteriophytochrome (light-regulated signal transduction histidine kinase) [Hymenobacter gelipurpurascens]|uniref:histidine kinase n=1 Tax=Hymenobacter gelipurpurascens TaxID=89968 RepID=A0A212UEC5_9BACT|nr:ATP-binding protein [Hymenobacter gelipurpurascens]SNC76599.1 Bacteriophytochrome (light-regulated signal transduction histidine kinase) [Hymenobacter gelipurpurascens]
MDQSAVIYSDESLLNAPVTLTNCDREPIHIPGSVQPYGFLLCLDEETKQIVHASENTLALLGIAAENLIGTGLEQLLSPATLAELEQLWPTLTEITKLLGARLEQVPGQPFYKIILHRHDQLLWLEFEPVAETGASVLDLPSLNVALGQMLGATSVLEFCQHAVSQVRDITGFDRVVMYRFAEDASGEVVAEAKRDDLEPFLGLHYPATDIPQQARAMYLKNWLRFIPDVAYVPARLHPVLHPTAPRPPDMTYAVLRSVSPIHLEYLRNMGVAATMTISIIADGVLWGMITCHHLTPRLVSYELRELCLFIGKTFSALLRSKLQHDNFAYQLHIRETQVRLFELVSRHDNFIEGLYKRKPSVADVINCGGAAICFEGEIITMGTTPTEAQIQELATWLHQNVPQDAFYTNSYVAQNPAGVGIRGTASGLLAISLSQESADYIIWFRPEQIQTVTWAGQTQKAEVLQDGQLHLSPRQSFEAWRQTVDSTSAPWLPMEIEAAQEIRLHLSDVRLKIFNELQTRAASLSRLNSELERSNNELDSFAYVASHDLKEPLRGIHNYSIFLLEDYAEQLDAEGVNKLQTLVRLSQRMESLIESLLQLSRVGRQELTVVETNVQEVVEDVLDMLQPRFEQTGTTATITSPLPTIRCDEVRIREVFNNLMTNAMRYSDQVQRLVRIGLAPAEVRGPHGTGNPADFHVFYVQDNGIGIDPKHHENVFKIFKRLHTQEKYGGGTGAGLSIAKKMVEKHHGEIWVGSVLGQGATFYFSLSKHL